MTYQTAIVVEGGAMRGIFSAGVLDVLHEHDLRNFDLAIGTSAGACNLASFLAGQHERNLRCYTNIMARPELFSVRRMLRGGHYMDLDWLWQRFAEEEPLDQKAFLAQRTELLSVATCAVTGRALYLKPRATHLLEDLKAGCAVPLLYRGPVHVEEHSVVDGGVADPIPVEEAHRRGARRLLVIRSRPSHVTKSKGAMDPLIRALLRRKPAVAQATRNMPIQYQRALSFMRSPPAGVEVLQLAPLTLLRTGRTTQDQSALRADYAEGRRLAQTVLPILRAWLSVA